MSSRRAAKATRPIFPSEDIIRALLESAHPRRALNALLEKETKLFDGPTGDASCHARTVVMNVAAEIVDRHFAEDNNLEGALDLIKVYKKEHINDKLDGRVKAVTDLKNEGRGSDVYERLFAEVTGLFDAEDWTLLVSFYSKTVDTTRSNLPWGTSFSRRAHKVYYASNPVAEASKKPSDLTDLDSSLRARVGQQNVEYLTNELDPIMQLHSPVEHEAVQMLKDERATIVLNGNVDYQVCEIYAIFFAVFYIDYAARRPFIMSVRRVMLVGGKQEWTHSDVLFWEPNRIGSWTYVAKPSVEQQRRVCTYYNMWSTYTEGAVGTGLESSSDTEFLTALKRADPAWLILQYAAVHPSYAGKADRRDFDKKAAWIALSRNIQTTCNFTPTHCPGLSFAPTMTGEERLPFATQWACAYDSGLPLEGREYGEVAGESNIFTTTDRPIRLSLNHVECSTYATVTIWANQLFERYVRAGRPPFGHYVARYGTQGFMWDSLDEAKKFTDMKPVDQRRVIGMRGLGAIYDK